MMQRHFAALMGGLRRQNTLRWISIVFAVVYSAVPRIAHASPPYGGTIFISPNIITPADPTAYSGLTYAGTGNRVMFDRRVNAFVPYTAFLFNATFTDHAAVEVQVNPEFGTPLAALADAERYARVIGQLPVVLRRDVETVWIHKGVQAFGGGNRNLLIHTGQADLYAADGILEETLVHEATHTSLDPAHASTALWQMAQAADGDFISTYARDNPTREDVAESFLPYLAARYRRSRIPGLLATTIDNTIPHRMRYFDQQAFNLSPFVASPLTPPANLSSSVNGTLVTLTWTLTPNATSYIVEAGSRTGASDLGTVSTTPASLSAAVGIGVYYVRVRSTNGVAVSEPSNEITVVVGPTCPIIAPPSGLTASVSGTTVTVRWNGVAGAASYVLEAGSSPALSNLAAFDTGTTATSFEATAVAPGTYYVRARSRTACAASTASNEIVIVVR
jgi:hypothetical protein